MNKREIISEATRPESVLNGLKADNQPKPLGEVLEKVMENIVMAQATTERIGAMEAAKEGVVEAVKAFAPGLSLGKILSDVGNELVQQGGHGES